MFYFYVLFKRYREIPSLNSTLLMNYFSPREKWVCAKTPTNLEESSNYRGRGSDPRCLRFLLRFAGIMGVTKYDDLLTQHISGDCLRTTTEYWPSAEICGAPFVRGVSRAGVEAHVGTPVALFTSLPLSHRLSFILCRLNRGP